MEMMNTTLQRFWLASLTIILVMTTAFGCTGYEEDQDMKHGAQGHVDDSEGTHKGHGNIEEHGTQNEHDTEGEHGSDDVHAGQHHHMTENEEDSAQPSPYVHMTERDIRALSAQEIDALLAGEGAGYALSAELNHYPGPLHVLELADKLELDTAQKEKVQHVYDEMKEEAQKWGRRLVDLEEELETAFREDEITTETVEQLTSEIAQTDGKLRETHLLAHIEMTSILSAEQVKQYDDLRGYTQE
jgi:hypothetical protein